MSVGNQEPEPSTSELKDQGNLEYKSQNYLKAAALYSRAIKLGSSLPAEEQAVLYRWAGGCIQASSRARACTFRSNPTCRLPATQTPFCLQQPQRGGPAAQQSEQGAGGCGRVHTAAARLGEGLLPESGSAGADGET